MSSRAGWLAAVAVGVFAAVGVAAPVPVPGADKFEPPTVTLGTLPGEKLMADVKAFANLLGGDKAVKQLEQSIDAMFGKKDIPGLDLTRAAAGYVYLRANIVESCGVLVIPTTNEKDAVATLEKLGLTAVAERVAGRYQLKTPDPDFPVPLAAQFADGGKLLYLTINTKPALLEKDQLIPPAKLIDAKATTHVSVAVYPERVPVELRKMVTALIDETLLPDIDRMEKQKPRDMPASFPAFVRELLDMGKRNLLTLHNQGEKITLGLHLNPKTANLESELVVAPKSGTPFATEIAAVKAPVGRFHQLMNKDSVLGGRAGLPTPLPKVLRETGGQFLNEWMEILSADAPAEAKPLFEAVGEQVKKLATDGTADGGFALVGPNKAGLYTGVAGIGAADTAGIDKAFRQAAKAAGEFIKLDAKKVGELSVHEIDPTPAMTADIGRIFGRDAKLYLAFGKDAVYAAFGPEWEAELKRAVALKPAAGPVFDLSAHGKRAVKLLPNEPFTGMFVEIGSRIDDFASYFAADVDGGKELRVKVKTAAPLMGFVFLFRAFGAPGGNGAFPPPVAPPPPPVVIEKK